MKKRLFPPLVFSVVAVMSMAETLLERQQARHARFVAPGKHTGESGHADESAVEPQSPTSTPPRKLNSLMLFGVMFSMCIGGGYGTEDAIGAAGPLPTLIAFIILPWIFCFPTALFATELSAAVPSNAGPIMWVNVALPAPFAVAEMMISVFVNILGNAAPVGLFADYFKDMFPSTNTPFLQVLFKLMAVVISTVMNCAGAEIVGIGSFALSVFCFSPFVILTVLGFMQHGIDWELVGTTKPNINFPVFFSMITWNLSYLEQVGVLAEEVRKPIGRTMVRGIVPMMFAYWIAYVIPTVAGVSAVGAAFNGTYVDNVTNQRNLQYSSWTAGYWSDVAADVGGTSFKTFMFVGGAVSSFGYLLSGQLTSSHAISGMAAMNAFPAPMSRWLRRYHPKTGTPMNAIVLNGFFVALLAATLDFTKLVATSQAFYMVYLSLAYISFLKLRFSWPHLRRPFFFPTPCNKSFFAICLFMALPLSVAISSTLMGMIVDPISAAITGGSLFLITIFSFLYCRYFRPDGIEGHIEEEELPEDTSEMDSSPNFEQTNEQEQHQKEEKEVQRTPEVPPEEHQQDAS